MTVGLLQSSWLMGIEFSARWVAAMKKPADLKCSKHADVLSHICKSMQNIDCADIENSQGSKSTTGRFHSLSVKGQYSSLPHTMHRDIDNGGYTVNRRFGKHLELLCGRHGLDGNMDHSNIWTAYQWIIMWSRQ